MHKIIFSCIVVAHILFCPTLYAAALNKTTVLLGHGIIAVEDISAVATIKGFLIIASDEAVDGKNYLQLLRKDPTGKYVVDHNILVFSGAEMDMEGLAVEKNTVYVIGSHASKRKKTKPHKSYKKNLRTFHDSHIQDEPSRDQLYRMVLDNDGYVLKKASWSLHRLLTADPVLKTFSQIPSKENGVDIEGLAIKDGWLYVGFRGPVFRENHVPILRIQFDDVAMRYSILYVRLAGRGIRGMTEVAGGFLLLAGPVGDGDGAYQLYFWDGNTMLVGKKRHAVKHGIVRLLAEIMPSQHKKAEGIVLIRENTDSYHVMIAYDSAKGVGDVLRSLVVPKPQ